MWLPSGTTIRSFAPHPMRTAMPCGVTQATAAACSVEVVMLAERKLKTKSAAADQYEMKAMLRRFISAMRAALLVAVTMVPLRCPRKQWPRKAANSECTHSYLIPCDQPCCCVLSLPRSCHHFHSFSHVVAGRASWQRDSFVVFV